MLFFLLLNLENIFKKNFFFCLVQFGAVPSRHQPAATLLFLYGVWNPYLGPAHQQVRLHSGEPLQHGYLTGFFSRWPNSDQVHWRECWQFKVKWIFQHVSLYWEKKIMESYCGIIRMLSYLMFVLGFFFHPLVHILHVMLWKVTPLLKFKLPTFGYSKKF